jgi:misacylated tRNA(Ala) deacylase
MGHEPVTATIELFRQDAYLLECDAKVAAIGEQAIVLDRTVFYPQGGGQAGDSGVLVLANGAELAIADTRKGKDAQGEPTGAICHFWAPNQDAMLAGIRPGDRVTARVAWERRPRMMRFHTDFNMTDPLDKEALTAGIARLVAAAVPVAVGSIAEEELDANPALVKSMSVQPPRGTGRIRTIMIGAASAAPDQGMVDFQPCGGTHVANTAEIGAVVVTKIEKKSATTRRVVLGFA